jgi:hypothetical protein
MVLINQSESKPTTIELSTVMAYSPVLGDKFMEITKQTDFTNRHQHTLYYFQYLIWYIKSYNLHQQMDFNQWFDSPNARQAEQNALIAFTVPRQTSHCPVDLAPTYHCKHYHSCLFQL